MITSVHILGVLLTVALLLVVSWWSGRKVTDALEAVLAFRPFFSKMMKKSGGSGATFCTLSVV